MLYVYVVLLWLQVDSFDSAFLYKNVEAAAGMCSVSAVFSSYKRARYSVLFSIDVHSVIV